MQEVKITCNFFKATYTMNLINYNLINVFFKLFNHYFSSKCKKIYRKQTTLTLPNACITVKFQITRVSNIRINNRKQKITLLKEKEKTSNASCMYSFIKKKIISLNFLGSLVQVSIWPHRKDTRMTKDHLLEVIEFQDGKFLYIFSFLHIFLTFYFLIFSFISFSCRGHRHPGKCKMNSQSSWNTGREPLIQRIHFWHKVLH